VTLKVSGLRERTRLLYSLGHQFLFGMLALGSGALAFAARQQGDTAVAGLAVKAGIFFAVCLAGSLLVARKWR